MKRRVMKIAVDDDQVPLELHHSLDGVTIPTNPVSGSGGAISTDTTLVQQKEKVDRKHEYLTALGQGNTDVAGECGGGGLGSSTQTVQKPTSVSFPHEHSNHLDNSQTTAVQQEVILEIEVCNQCQLCFPHTNQYTQCISATILLSQSMYILYDSILPLRSRNWTRR